MSEYIIKPLTSETWDAFGRLLDKHKGAGFGAGCWCTWFHPRTETGNKAETGRACKERLVRDEKAHAALVFDGDVAVAWCQFGSPAELPSIDHRKEYEAGLVSWPTIASPASLSTGITGAKGWPGSRSTERWT